MNRKTKGLISIIIVMLIWGSAFTVTKVAVDEVPPFLMAFLRNLVGSILLLALCIGRKKKMTGRNRLPYFEIFLLGLTGVATFYALFNISLVYTTAVAGALIQGFMPVAVAVPAVLFLKEKLSNKTIVSIMLSVVGVVLIGFIGTDADAKNAPLGNALMLLSVFSWAAYTIILKRLHPDDPVMITALSTAIGTLLLLPVVGIELWDRPLPMITFKGWLAILYLGAFPSAVAFALYAIALKRLSAAQIGNFMNLDPVIGAIIAIVFLGDKMTAWQIAGAVLVLAGIWMSMTRNDN